MVGSRRSELLNNHDCGGVVTLHGPSTEESGDRDGTQTPNRGAGGCTRADSATALVRLGHPATVDAELATALELWQATPTDRAGDLDYVSASLELEWGRLDVAEPFAVASVRRWEGGSSQRRRTISGIVLAAIHIRGGEPDGARLAHRAITGVTKLSSARARQRLDPLVAALQARPSTEHRELARMAHHVATTRI